MKGGAPVPGIRVIVTAPGTSTGPAASEARASATSAPDGRFRVDGLSPGRREVWVQRSAVDWKLVTAVRIPDVKTIDVVVPDGGAMTGRVVTSTNGAAVAGAEVTLRHKEFAGESYAIARATTDAEGCYTLRTIEDETKFDAIEVVQDSWIWVPERDHGVGDSAGTIVSGSVVHRDFVLQPAARIGGTVTGPAGAVAGARVFVVWHPENESHRTTSVEATADTSGRWSIGGLAEQTVAVHAFAPAMRQSGIPAPYHNDYSQFDALPEAARRTLRAGETASIDVTLEDDPPEPSDDQFPIAGAVLNAQGDPIASARVLAGYGAPTYTRQDGTFTGTFVGKTGWARSVAVTARGFVEQEKRIGRAELTGDDADAWEESEARKRDAFVPYAEVNKMVIRLRRAPVIRGKVASALGLPIAGARVLVAQHQHDRHGSSHVDWYTVPAGEVASDGTYEVALPDTTENESVGGGMMGALLPEYAVCIEAEGHAPVIGPSVKRVAGQDTYVVDLVVGGGATLSGRVVADADGRSLSGAPITLSPRRGFGGAWNDPSWPPAFAPVPEDTVEAVTGVDGAFTISSLTPGNYSVSVQMQGYAVAWKEATVPVSAPVELRVRTGRVIAGVVLGPDERPTSGVEVWLQREGEDPSIFVGKSVGLDGKFQFLDVTPGRYRIRAETEGERAEFAASLSDWVVDGTTGVVVRMARGLRISGRVVDVDGAPAPHLVVECTPELVEEKRSVSVETGDDGRFQVVPLASGKYTVTLPELGLTRTGVEAGASVEFAPAGRLRIAGRVLGESGEGFYPWEYVHIRPVAGGTERTARADGEGRFAFRYLDAGEYELAVEHEIVSESGDVKRVVKLPAGTRAAAGETGLELRLR